MSVARCDGLVGRCSEVLLVLGTDARQRVRCEVDEGHGPEGQTGEIVHVVRWGGPVRETIGQAPPGRQLRVSILRGVGIAWSYEPISERRG